MVVAEMLDELKGKALRDEKLKKELLDTRKEKNPMTAFCKKMSVFGLSCLRNGSHRSRRRVLCNNEKEHKRRRRKFSYAGRGRRFLRVVLCRIRIKISWIVGIEFEI